MSRILLEDWLIIGLPIDCYKPPEQKSIHLMGKVYGHSLHEDGEDVLTSVIMHADGREIMTVNTKYTLGKVSEKYKNWYFEKYGKILDEDNPFPD